MGMSSDSGVGSELKCNYPSESGDVCCSPSMSA